MRRAIRGNAPVGLLAAGLVVAHLAAGRAPGADPPAPPATVLAAGSTWREHATLSPPRVSLASARSAGMELSEDVRIIKRLGGRRSIVALRTPPPPAGWRRAGFDDSGWRRTRGAGRPPHEVALLCRRGRFVVPDPAGVRKLTLELEYYGGVVVYLNGREVLRASLPAGELPAGTPGADYPEAAFFVSAGPRKGKLLQSYYDRQRKEQFALRPRRAGPVEVPTSLLTRGVNVLAVACHRCDFPARCRRAGVGHFCGIGVSRLFLRAGAAAGAAEPVGSRPPGLHAWNAAVTDEVNELSYAAPGEPPGPVRIAALRGGRFSGQVVVGSTEPIASLSARVGRLGLAAGAGAIPPAAVKVRYGRPGRTMRLLGGSVYGGPTGTALGVYFRRFDGLTDRPPETVPLARPAQKLRREVREALGLPASPPAGAVVPIWVTVDVPADAAPGAYRGRLTVSAKGRPDIVVGVELEVFGWTVPPVGDRISQFSVYQSPETLAAHYKVPPWSARHWELIERSVRLVGEAGNHTVILPLLSKEQGGNEESYVRWVRRPDGGFDHDTSILERYLEVYLRHHRPRQIKAICLTVWGNAGVAAGNPYQANKYDARGLPIKTRGTLTVTAMDPATGRKWDLPVPPLGSEEFEAFWRGALKPVGAKLAAAGLADRMMFGMPADPPVPALVVAAFHNILPEVGWFVGNHPGATRYRYDRADRTKTVPVRHCERVYTGPIPDPSVKRSFGWRRKEMTLAFNRYGFGPLCLYPDPQVWAFRILMEADLAANHRGAGRIGADYWPMGTGSGSGGAGTFYLRYPASSIGQTGMASNCAALLAAGPDGPVTSARFENVREGIQNAEAVIFVQEAVLSGRLGAPLAARCQQMLDERVNAIRVYRLGLGQAGWQGRDRRLYRAAAEVAAALARTAPRD